MLKIYRVTLVDAQNVTRVFLTDAITTYVARLNAHDAYGKDIRVKAIEFHDYAN